MSARPYVALLRGINVGGRNRVAMEDLRRAFEEERFGDVRTHLQSGNVLFTSDAPRASLASGIEAMLERWLDVSVVVVLRSRTQMRNVVGKAPPGFGEEPDRYHSDAMFLRHPLTAQQAMRVIELRDGVDQAWPGTGVIYFARLSERRTQSRMSRIVGTPEYQHMTIRSWSTTTRLVDLLG